MKIEIQVERVDKEIEMPRYIRESDVAFDLRSAEDVVVPAGRKKVVKTGIKIAIPRGYAGLIWDRSGLAAKNSLHTLAGVIDSAYRGEVGVVLKNLSREDFVVEKNMRIAQMLIQPVVNAAFVEVEGLSEDTDRGANGFGSTGLK